MSVVAGTGLKTMTSGNWRYGGSISTPDARSVNVSVRRRCVVLVRRIQIGSLAVATTAIVGSPTSAATPSPSSGLLTVQLPLTVGTYPAKCDIEPWFHLLEAVAWPLVIAFLAWRFREPLVEFARSFGGRVSKVSLFSIGIEFTAAQPSEQSPLLEEIRQPARSAPIADSAIALIDQVKSTEPADYALIDIGDGEEWLTTRLYIAAVMIQRMRGISVFVFVNHSVTGQRRFLAVADVQSLRWQLAKRYPWLEVSFAASYGILFQYDQPLLTTVSTTTSDTGALQPHQAPQLVQDFVNRLQQPNPPPSGASQEHWVSLDSGICERADWVNVTLLYELLPTSSFAAKVEELADQPKSKRVRAVLRAHAPFVAVIDREGQFLSLLDRRAFLERIATTLSDEPE
jgi:hypothetical protein